MIPHTRSGLVITSTFFMAALWCGSVTAAEDAASTPPTPAVEAKQATPSARSLDLRAPDITRLFTSEQLNRILAATFRRDIEEIEVQGARDRLPSSTPSVWPGLGAPIWAVLNPTQAWRIFAPLPPDQTRGMHQARFDATADYLEPAGVPSPHAQ
jgi:hypothetical protein